MSKSKEKPAAARSGPVSLAPLSFEDAVKALAAAPPMKVPKRRPVPRARKSKPKKPA